MPIACATSVTLSAPIASVTRANTVLTDAAVAEASVIMPRPLPSLLLTVQVPLDVGIFAGEDESIFVLGEMPSCNAATRVNVLKDEPGWRCA